MRGGKGKTTSGDANVRASTEGRKSSVRIRLAHFRTARRSADTPGHTISALTFLPWPLWCSRDSRYRSDFHSSSTSQLHRARMPRAALSDCRKKPRSNRCRTRMRRSLCPTAVRGLSSVYCQEVEAGCTARRIRPMDQGMFSRISRRDISV